MLPYDTRGKIKNNTAGIIIKGQQDHCTAIRNLLCASFATSTTIKKEFESEALIKEKQTSVLVLEIISQRAIFRISISQNFFSLFNQQNFHFFCLHNTNSITFRI